MTRRVVITDHTGPDGLGLGASVIPEPCAVSGPGASGVGLGLPAGIGLTGSGGLDVAGLQWPGARAYDPAARGFLSTDPLAPVLGAGWDGNPYSYAGNNPLNASDPTGLSPLTDVQLQDFDKSMGSHWEYVAAGAAIVLAAVATVAILCVPGANILLLGAIAGGLSAGGVSLWTQKSEGDVNWWSVAGSTTLGAAMGAVSGGSLQWARNSVAGTGATRATAAMKFSGGVNGGLGAAAGGIGYLKNHDWRIQNGREFAGKVAGGAAVGAVSGLAAPAGGSLAMRWGFTATSKQALWTGVGINAGGSAFGSMTDDIVSGKPVDFGKAVETAGFGAASSLIKTPGQSNVTTLNELQFGVRSWGGLVTNQTNTRGLWGGAFAGGGIGIISDDLQCEFHDMITR